MDVTELIDTYCMAWSHPDPKERELILGLVWTDSGHYTDPGVHAKGKDELLAHIDRVLLKRPGSRVERTTAVEEHHDVAKFGWAAIDAKGELVTSGTDIVIFTSSPAKIERVIGFFDR
tara:strand:- start:30283 stop:30636 length:354 start_codon:yes stop_codon:yes gene_type:complete